MTVSLFNAVLILGGIPSFIIVCTLGYLTLARYAKMRIYDDFLMPSSIVLLIVVTVTGSACLFLLFFKEIGSTRVPLTTLIPAATMTVGAFGIVFTFVMGSVQNTWNARQQLYQTLEIQSILLFRFENDNEDRVRSLWKKDLAPTDKIEQFCVKEYICQILNLFEMAVRFQLQGVLPRNVFGSWVIWMWELCTREVFHQYWLDKDDLPFNYLSELRGIVNTGIAIAQSCGECERNKRQYFFDAVSQELNCPEVRNWFKETDDQELLKIIKDQFSRTTSV